VPTVDIASGAENDTEREQVLAIVSSLLGFQVVGWIQRGREPRRSEYSMVLPDGREVLIGRSPDVLKASSFRAAVLDAVGIVLPAFKSGKWTKLCSALMRIVDRIENNELRRDNQAREWLRLYTRDASIFHDDDWANALEHNDPFIKDGELYVYVGSLHQFLCVSQHERIAKSDLYGYLGTIGFTNKTMSARDSENVSRSRSYWRGPADVLAIEQPPPL